MLLFADSHLGLDLPVRARVDRRRRGHDFMANHAAALAPALNGEVDVVVHGGDVFHRPRVAASVAYQAYGPLLEVAERGVPVFIVPGNHERARLPHPRLLAHRNVHVFDVPRTFVVAVGGVRLALAGFPFAGRGVRAGFLELLGRTGWQSAEADLRVLCVHECVEGATVGPGDYTFTTAPDVIRARDIPSGFSAVVSGHIHRAQVLTTHLSGRALAAPVYYPGSVERTSVAEMNEAKGYYVLELAAGAPPRAEFRPLPARPMLVERIPAGGADGRELAGTLDRLVQAAPADAVLRISVDGAVTDAHRRLVSAARLRSLAPATMNLEVRLTAEVRFVPRVGRSARRHAARSRGQDATLELGL